MRRPRPNDGRAPGLVAPTRVRFHLIIMSELIVLVGLQAAGKSTFFGQRFAETHTLVSKDRLRNNRRPERRQQQLIAEALRNGRSVVVDNTNPSRAERAAVIAIGQSFAARIVGYFFVSAVAECLTRNAARPERNRVPEVGLFATAKRLVTPAWSEGFHHLWAVETLPDFTFAITPLPGDQT